MCKVEVLPLFLSLLVHEGSVGFENECRDIVMPADTFMAGSAFSAVVPKQPDLPNQQTLDEIEGDFPMDSAVISLFPPGSVVLSAESYGSSAWTQTGCITIELPDGEFKKYFMKLALRDHGRNMLLGECTAIATIDFLCPGMVPKPLGWGKFRVGYPETYFFIEDFKDMELGLPDPVKLAQRAVQLHSNKSRNGMFGFDVTTFNGKLNHVTKWEPSWTKFFVRLLSNTLRIDEEANGPWPELAAAAEQVLTAVCPRLLDVLQDQPEPITPSLIHADLWAGNTGTDEETGEVIFYDCGSYYAHNEMELGMWRRDAAQYLGQRYLQEYQQLYRPAEPRAEFDDRNRLYCLQYLINYSVGHAGALSRHTALNDMAYLCAKYAPRDGLTAYDPQKDPTVRREIDISDDNGRM